MIISFADSETNKVFNQEYSKKLPSDIQKRALIKLIMLDNAQGIRDVIVPPSNRLEKLSGKESNTWSIRINDQWRIVFVPSDDWKNFYSVGITDYH